MSYCIKALCEMRGQNSLLPSSLVILQDDTPKPPSVDFIFGDCYSIKPHTGEELFHERALASNCPMFTLKGF